MKLSGNIFNDGNGNSNGKVDGIPINKPDNSQLYVTLIDENGDVVASKAVGDDGKYLFTGRDGVAPNSDYQIILTTAKSSTKPMLPDNWNNTGENINSKGDGEDGDNNGVIAVSTKGLTVDNRELPQIDFGINKKPRGEDYIVGDEDAIINIPGNTQYPIKLDISDLEDGTPTTVTIKELPDPNTGTLYYDGRPVKEGEPIENFDPSKLTVDPADGNQVVEFSYTTTDVAGVESEAKKVRVPFIGKIKLGDTVWYDENLNGKQDSGELGVVDVKVTLLDEKGDPALGLDGKPVVSITDKNGHYLLDNVIPGSNYKIQVELPNGYMTTIANVGSDMEDSDANKDGIISVINPTKDNYSYDVGIYCECDDYKVNAQKYKSSGAPALSVLGGLFVIITLGLFATRREE